MVNNIGIKRNHDGKKVNVNKSLNEMNVCSFLNELIIGQTHDGSQKEKWFKKKNNLIYSMHISSQPQSTPFIYTYICNAMVPNLGVQMPTGGHNTNLSGGKEKKASSFFKLKILKSFIS